MTKVCQSCGVGYGFHDRMCAEYKPALAASPPKVESVPSDATKRMAKIMGAEFVPNTPAPVESELPPERLTVSGFIKTMADRFGERADIAVENRLNMAFNTLEAFECAGETADLTTECAHAIVDSELEHWDD